MDTVYFVKIEIVETVVLLSMCQETYAAVEVQIKTNLCKLICVDCYYKNNNNRIKS